MNYSHDFSSIQPIYSLDSNESGFKTGSSSNSADHDEMLRLMTELEDTKQQYVGEHRMVVELEQQLSVLAQENQKLQTRIVQSNTLDEMKSVHEELSFLEEVRQGQMCTRCLKSFDCRMVPTENTSYIGTEGDEDDDQSLMDLLNNTSTHPGTPVFRSAVTIKVNVGKLYWLYSFRGVLHLEYQVGNHFELKTSFLILCRILNSFAPNFGEVVSHTISQFNLVFL